MKPKIETLMYYLFKGILFVMGLLCLPLLYKMCRETFKQDLYDICIQSILILAMIACLVGIGYIGNNLIEFLNPKNDENTPK